MSKPVTHDYSCPTGKRRFATEREADRALGRAQHKRKRIWGDGETLRGLVAERRFYEDCDCGGFHLTHLDRRQLLAA